MEGSPAYIGASSFTHNGDYFALLSRDGRLRIWDTISGKVVHEFASNSAAHSSCTCLCWTRTTLSKRAKKKLKRKHKVSGNDVGPLFSSLSIGTEKGFLFCYNPTTGEIEIINKEGHSAKINCVVYHEKEDMIYTCSDDKFIIEWCAGKQQIKSKWKADEQSVKMVCVSPSGKALLSAGCSIKLWNIDSKDLLQIYNGHSSPISFLTFSPYRQTVNDGNGDDGYYFVSGSTEDRVINAWQVNSKRPDRMAVASFIISDVASFVDIILDGDADDKPLTLCVGCVDGRIHFFKCTMNGRLSRPVDSSKTVDYVMKEGSSSTPIPFINARLQKTNDVQLNLVIGQTIKPVFTTLRYDALDVSSKIEKDMPKNLLLSEIKPEIDSSIALADTNCCTNVIADAAYLPVPVKGGESEKSVSSNLQTGFKEELQKEGTVDDLSMQERMKLEETTSKGFIVKMKQKKDAPSAGSFSQLIVQALHSGDQKLLNVLHDTRVTRNVMLNTISRIPNNLVDSFLKTLSNGLLWNPNRAQFLIPWLRAVLSVHLTFLLTSDTSRESLSTLYRFVKSQEEIHLPLLTLHGKIEMLCSHVSECNNDEDDLASSVVVYNDDSDDETEELWQEYRKTEAEKVGIDLGTSDDDVKIDTDEITETESDTDEVMSTRIHNDGDEKI